MKQKLKKSMIGLFLLYLTTLTPGCCTNPSESAPAAENKSVESPVKAAPISVSADDILSNPKKYIDKRISVKGVVAKVDRGIEFRLGCEDACLSMPVEYKHVSQGENIRVTGTIRKNSEGKHIFAAEDVAKIQ